MTMVRSQVRALVGLLGLAALAGGCADRGGPDQPTAAFSRDVSETRVFEAYRQSDRSRSEDLRLGARASYIRVRIECAADRGWVRITLAGQAGALHCERPVGGGSLMWSNASATPAARTLTVRAPEGARWSMAVDTRAHPFDPANP